MIIQYFRTISFSKNKKGISINEIMIAFALIVGIAFFFLNKVKQAGVKAEKCEGQLSDVVRIVENYAKDNALAIKADNLSKPEEWMDKIRLSSENMPECPSAGTYRLNDAWELYCSVHEKPLVNTDVIEILSKAEHKFDIVEIIEEDVEIHEKGLRHMRLNEFDDAVKCFIEAGELKPQEARYKFALAEAYYRLGELEKALDAVKKTRSIQNNKAVARLHNAISSALKVKNYLSGLKDRWRIIYLRKTMGELDSIRLSDIDGMNDRSVAQSPNITSVQYHKSVGKDIYYAAEAAAFKVSINGGKPEKIHDNLNYPLYFSYVAADNKTLVFSSKRFSNTTHLFIKKIDNSMEITDCTVLTEETPGDFSPVWQLDGSEIFFLSGQGYSTEAWKINPDGRDLKALTRNGYEEKGITLINEGTALSWSRLMDVETASGSELNSELYVFDLETEEETNISRSASFNEEYPSWAPDGSMVAFIGWGDDARRDLYLMDSSGKNRRKLTGFAADPETGRSFHPVMAWSPESDFLVFSYGFRSSLNLYIADITSGAIMQLTDSTESDIEPEIIPNR